MTTKQEDVLYVGFNKRVVALDRRTGDVCWSWKPQAKGGSYVTLLLESDMLLVSMSGYMWALDPVTGVELWHNPLKGMGTGVASLVSYAHPRSEVTLQAAAADAAAAAAVAAAG